MEHFFSGTSGLVLPGPKDTLPQEYQHKPRLAYYASLFNSIEINSSFYKLPLKRTVAKWADSVPEHFRFTFKLSKSVTHEKGKEINPDEILKFMDAINEVGSKAGCILVQFPPGAGRDLVALEKILNNIRKNSSGNWVTALEFRNLSWYGESTYRMLEDFEASLVIHDIPGKSAPADDYESQTVYLRFHGPGGRYRGSYENDFLGEYASYIREYLKEGKNVFAYFNNTMGDALNNLGKLNSEVGMKKY